MEVVGVTAAAITFGGVILKTSKELYRLTQRIRYARSEIRKLVSEMGMFSDLYEDFYKVCVLEQRKKTRPTFSTRRLIRWIRGAIKAFGSLRDRVEALAGDSRYSMLETLAAHVKWFFSENEVKYLRYSLTLARENMRGFQNLRILESINEEIQMIKDVLAQGDRQKIRRLEDEFEVSLEEKLKELKKTSHNRRRQNHAIQARIDDAADELEQQGKKTSHSPRVPQPEQLLRTTDDIEDYAVEVRKQRLSNTPSAVTPRRRSTRANSVEATNSTASRSFVSKPSSYSEPVELESFATSPEELSGSENHCGNCTGICECSDTEPDPALPSRPPSPDCHPPPRSTTFGHPSHRFDRNWQRSTGDDAIAQLVKDACSPSAKMLSLSSIQPSMHKSVDLIPNHDQEPLNEDSESNNVEELDEASDDKNQASPFHPVAGVQGKFPPKWRNRHQRRESTDDHWHKRL